MLRSSLSDEQFARTAKFLPGQPEHAFRAWEFQTNAVFFAGALMTTIGYGNFMPQTRGGSMFAAAYAIFSVGLMGYW